MKKLTKMQTRFNNAMLAGKIMSVSQTRAIGFANPYDAAYQARTVHELNVCRLRVKANNGRKFSAYFLVA